jgi:hypothetical protein
LGSPGYYKIGHSIPCITICNYLANKVPAEDNQKSSRVASNITKGLLKPNFHITGLGNFFLLRKTLGQQNLVDAKKEVTICISFANILLVGTQGKQGLHVKIICDKKIYWPEVILGRLISKKQNLAKLDFAYLVYRWLKAFGLSLFSGSSISLLVIQLQ